MNVDEGGCGGVSMETYDCSPCDKQDFNGASAVSVEDEEDLPNVVGQNFPRLIVGPVPFSSSSSNSHKQRPNTDPIIMCLL